MKKYGLLLGLVLLVALALAGCERARKDTEIILTTDFAPDEVFRIDSEACYLPEINVYMRTSQSQYEGLFGKEIWGKDIGGQTLESQLKDTILARVAQIKVMKLLAGEYSIELSNEEKDKAKQAAEQYIEGLSEDEKAAMGIDADSVANMYCEYALANKLYEYITKDVNPEISDDEARTIKVKHLLLKTYTLDKDGNKQEFEQLDKLRTKAKIRKIMEEINGGADFDAMAEKYNQDKETTYSFMKGTMPESFEEAAFSLETDELSGIVETEYGFHLIKCISTFDQAETDANKLKLIQKQKNEAFNGVYTDFVKTVYSNLNQKLWDSLTFENTSEVKTSNFFDVYEAVFGQT